MRLRNKKTGAVANYSLILQRETGITNNEAPIRYGCGTLAKLNEDWEDYKPKEPLIKDEKIRKAVRAWAEANEMEFMDIIDDSTIKDSGSKHIEFLGSPFKGLPKNSYYIAELCGEEEE